MLLKVAKFLGSMSSHRYCFLVATSYVFIVASSRGDLDMDRLDKVSRSARAAGEIYAHSHSDVGHEAMKEVLLVSANSLSYNFQSCLHVISKSNALARAEMDSEIASERVQVDVGPCPGCVRDFAEKCPVVHAIARRLQLGFLI